PGVVDAHGVVGRDRAVQERPLRPSAVLLAEQLECAGTLPVVQDGPFLGGEVYLRVYLVERHGHNLAGGRKKLILPKGPRAAANVRRAAKAPRRKVGFTSGGVSRRAASGCAAPPGRGPPSGRRRPGARGRGRRPPPDPGPAPASAGRFPGSAPGRGRR